MIFIITITTQERYFRMTKVLEHNIFHLNIYYDVYVLKYYSPYFLIGRAAIILNKFTIALNRIILTPTS